MSDRYRFLQSPSQSYWLTPPEQPSFPELRKDLNTDVAIVGGGIAGLTLAFLLHRQGVRSVLLEADRLLFGTTGHTTAKITSQHELIYDRLLKKIGREQAQQYAAANEAAIGEIARIIQELNIDCDFLPQSAFVYTESEKNIEKINNEVRAAIGLGIKAQYVESIPFDIPVKGGVRFDGQAQFHPRKYLLALISEIAGKSCAIYEGARVVDLEETEGGYRLKTGGGCAVSAQAVVIASHYPFYNKPGLYFARLHVERSYIIAVKTEQKYPGGMYINAEDPTRSLRSQPTGEGTLTLIGGENHKTGQQEDTALRYMALADFAHDHFTVLDVPFHWSAQDCLTLDGIPYAGRYTSDTAGLYVMTGFGKWGMTNSMASAMVVRDLVVRGESGWQDVYSPSRFHVEASIKNVLVENAGVAASLVKGKLEPLPDNVEIAPGEGKVIDVGGHRAGAYRDEEGKLHVVDTTCTHMGCELSWNPAEKSWDCPCHGSRFDIDGAVVEGPALRALNDGKSVNTLEKLVNDEF